MILMYEDEPHYIQEYIEAIEKEKFFIRVYKNAESFLRRARDNYRSIQLFIVDIMVFGPGNEFGGRSTGGGARCGLVILDEIEKLEKEYPDILPRNKIIFTNRKGPVFEEAQKDYRVLKAIHKSDVLPSEFVEIVKEAV